MSDPVPHAHGRRLATTAVVAGALCAAPLFAQPSLELRVSERETHVDEPVVVQIVVRDFEQADDIDFPPLENCDVQALGAPAVSETITILGRQRITSRTRTHTYEVTPRAVGEFVIPPIRLKVDGRDLGTPETRIQVRSGDSDALLIVEASADDGPLYVGQRAVLRLSIWVRPPRSPRRVLSGREVWQEYVDLRRSRFGPFPLPQAFSQRERRQPDGTSATYYLYETSATLVLDRPGMLAFDDVVIAMDYPTRFAYNVFGDEQATASRRLRVRARASAVEVRALPTVGRPADFTGAVGEFHLTATAKPTTVRVGDPIDLTISIGGDGPLETLAPPALDAQPRLLDGFRVPSETLAGAMVAGRRQFTQTIRARRPDVTEIPPITYSYFNPRTARYETASSEPIRLSVRPAETLAGVDVVGSDAPTAPPSGDSALDGLRDIVADERTLLSIAPDVRETHVLVVTLSPAAVFAGAAAALRLRRGRSVLTPLRRRQAALRAARRRLALARALAPAEQARAIEAALCAYLAERLGRPPAGFVGREALTELAQRGVDRRTIERLGEVIERCEAASYAGRASGGDGLPEMALHCVQALERAEL